jgi:hypothetical protein
MAVPPETVAQIVAAMEAAAKAKESKVVAWLKNEWSHIPTWAMGITALLKLFGKL